jgi:hypothetical protein
MSKKIIKRARWTKADHRTLKAHSFAAAIVAAVALVSFAPAANASTYSITGNLGGVLIDANMTTADTLDAVGGYDVLSIDGTVSGWGNILSLANNPNQPNISPITSVGFGGTNMQFDNVFFPTDPHFDTLGLIFSLSSGVSANLYGDSPGNYTLWVGNWQSITSGDLAIAQTPLPAALPLFATGLGVMGWLGRRRKRKARAA